MSPDAEAFLLSWTQLRTALFLDPGREPYLQALRAIEQRLQNEFSVESMQVVTRTETSYTVTLLEKGNRVTVEFPAEEVEDFA